MTDDNAGQTMPEGLQLGPSGKAVPSNYQPGEPHRRPDFPQPEVWPECSGCAVPCVLRRMDQGKRGMRWAWAADCSCVDGYGDPLPAALANADGWLPNQ